jgi:platelet-activating factor acetylhydrolase
MEIEVPVDNPRTFSNITRNKEHILRLDTVLVAIYYPSAQGSGTGRDPAGHKAWSRATWLPRPRRRMAVGYGKFGGMPPSIAVPFFSATTMLTKLPAFRNAPLASHWEPQSKGLKMEGWKQKDEEGRPPVGVSLGEKPIFPIIVFSHGLGGTRTAYSMICGEVMALTIRSVAVVCMTQRLHRRAFWDY